MAMDSRELDSPLADLDGLPCDVRDLHDDLHIQAVVGSDRDSPGSLKRAGCDLGADGDLGTAKKRRKQSKPVRIDAGEGAAALGDALAEVLGDVVDNGGDARVSPSLDLEVQVHCQTEGEARDEIPLNLCSLPKTEPSSPTGLDDFGTFPTHAGLKSVSPGGGLDVDLAVQHQQSERMAMNNFWGMSPPFLYPMMAPQSEQGLSQGMPQGLQQGLPQGLQQGLQQGLPPGLPPGLPQGLQQGLPPGLSQGLTQSNNHQSRCSPDNRTGSCTIFNPDAYCELCNKEFCNKYFLKTHKANKHGIFTNSPSQVPTQQQQLQQLQQQPQQPPQPPQPSPQQQQSSPSSNDTYQHGLLPPRTLSPNSDSHVKLSSSPLRLQKDLISAKHGKNLFQRKIKVKSFGSNGEDVSLPPVVKVEDEYYDTDMDRLLSRMSPLQSADGLRDDTPAILKAAVQEDVGEGGSAGDSNESTGILRKEAVPPQEILDKPVFTPEKMRSLGVINPEAFCEICCKEYCNKYFLRTHKWKRHGIAPPEGEQDKQETQRPPAPSWLQQLQQHAAPLNLIMEEATNQGDAICKFCGQWFPSEQVLQVHVAFVHMTKKQDKEGGDPADMRKEPLEDKRGGERSKQMAPEQIESIMDDMKKVQTMLFQLNTLNNQLPGVAGEQQGKRSPGAADEARSGESPVNGGLPCAICKKTLPDKAALQQHVQEQHWSAPIKVERDVDVTPVPPGREAGAEQPQQQQQQLQQQPQPPPPPPPQPAEPKPTAPTSSYCEICNKELCNKYFMKTHMQRMHGIEIENGSQIGGVVCDICNKELCSKYFLRVHKQNTHGIVDETNGPPTQVRGDGGAGGLFSGSHFLDAGSQALKPTDLSEMSHRYFTHFNEVCSICNRRFRSVKWLKAHLMNDHGRSEYEAATEANDRLPKLQPGLHPNDLGVQLGLGPGLLQGPGAAGPRERGRGEGKARHGRAQDGGAHAHAHAAKNGNHFMSNLMQVAGTSSKEYRCSYCPFSTPVLAFLYVHEKTHTGLAYMPEQKRELQCPICFKTCTKPEQFQRHLLSHQFAGLPGPGGLPGALWDPRNSVYAGHHKEPKREKQLPPPQQPAAPRGTPERDEDGADVDERVRFAEPARHREAPAEAKRSGKCPKCGGDLAPGERCAACGGGGKELSSLQSLLKETVTSDVKKRLEDAAKLNDIPATYAVPKTQDSDADPFIMQPFIIEEPRGEEGSLGVVGGAPPVDKKFVPSLVFLPVKERLSRPLTASFTLTPA